jgi:transposase
LLYDVTTLYFEIDKEDEYRKSGLSKERRLEPQIVIGLLVDDKGFPLAISSFEGNKAETKTMLPILKEFRQRCNVKEMTVVADAGMLSGENLELLEGEGFKFIVGSRLSKTPYEIEEYRKAENEQLIDGQIFETQKVFKSKQSRKETQRRVVYQYRQKRAELDLRNIAKQIRKAQWQIENKVFTKKPKFLKLTQTTAMLDEGLINEARLKAGIKGYVTNLDCDAKIIIDGYHNLFHVEKSFRMAKSDLQARPIFHQTRDSIEAHLTVCFAALGICRYIQDRTTISIKKFIRRLSRLRTAVIEIAGQEHIAEPAIDIETKKIIKELGT